MWLHFHISIDLHYTQCSVLTTGRMVASVSQSPANGSHTKSTNTALKRPSSIGSFNFSDHSSRNNVVVRTTEGWLELFLTTPEKFKFGQWDEKVRDKSLVGQVTQTQFEYLAQFVPPTLAPNVLSLFGLGTLGQAWYLTYQYGKLYGSACTWLSVVAITIFGCTSFLTEAHADRLRQRNALGVLFKYSCDCAATVFLALLTSYCLGATNTRTQWHVVQIAQLVLFLKHLSAFSRNAGMRYHFLSGPGEVLIIAVSLLAMRAIVGLEWIFHLYEIAVTSILYSEKLEIHTTPQVLEKYKRDPNIVGSEFVMVIYYTIYLVAVTRTLLLKKPHGWSRFGLAASLLMRVLPALLFHVNYSASAAAATAEEDNDGGGVQVADVISDGLFMAVLTSDITLAKMAGRELHPWVVLMSFAAVLNHGTILALVMVYYIAVFADLCSYLNMPLLTSCRNVYCDGVYDLCHIGHKLLFQNALQFGNRLFVGVVGDEDANTYKRPPIMTHDERCAEVEACKAVTKVIPNAPCFGITREFLDDHQIHVVAFGEEYCERYPNPQDDPYYRVPREMGIASPLPRTQGLSTSDLIRRIQNARPAEEKQSPT